jgi:hypothetical protein
MEILLAHILITPDGPARQVTPVTMKCDFQLHDEYVLTRMRTK